MNTYLRLLSQVIVASGAVKHEDFVLNVNNLFTKLSDNPITATQLVAKEPAIFTGSEVGTCMLFGSPLKQYLFFSFLFPPFPV